MKSPLRSSATVSCHDPAVPQLHRVSEGASKLWQALL